MDTETGQLLLAAVTGSQSAVSLVICVGILTGHASRVISWHACPMWARGNSSLLTRSLSHFPHLLFYLLCFTFSLSYLLYLFPYFSLPSLSIRVGPLRFQAGGHRRRQNLGLIFCVVFVLYVFFS